MGVLNIERGRCKSLSVGECSNESEWSLTTGQNSQTYSRVSVWRHTRYTGTQTLLTSEFRVGLCARVFCMRVRVRMCVCTSLCVCVCVSACVCILFVRPCAHTCVWFIVILLCTVRHCGVVLKVNLCENAQSSAFRLLCIYLRGVVPAKCTSPIPCVSMVNRCGSYGFKKRVFEST